MRDVTSGRDLRVVEQAFGWCELCHVLVLYCSANNALNYISHLLALCYKITKETLALPLKADHYPQLSL